MRALIMSGIIKQMLVVLLCSAAVTAQAQTIWYIQDDYTIDFDGKKARGTFRGLEGEINFDPDRLDLSGFEVSVDVSTISTGNKTKDKHARGKKWFGAETFPKIHFRSSGIRQTAGGYLAHGELELHGIEKTIDIPFSFTDTGDQGLFEGTMTVNRKDFGIMGNMFGFMVGDEFEVKLKIPVQKANGL